MKKIRFGLVGCGMISPKHIDAIKQYAEAELVAVCDTIKERSDKIAQEENCKSYQNYENLLKEDLDIISICTPSGMHAEMSIKALGAGKHVLCEKPMALNTKDTNKIIEAEKNSGRKFLLVKQNKYNPPVVALKDAVYHNKLGDLIMVNSNVYWNRNDQYYANESWRGTKEIDGGMFFTLASHFLDLMLWIGGPVESVQSIMRNYNHPQIETEDAGIVLLKFKNGAIGKILVTTCVQPKNMEGNLYVLGTKGTVKIGGKYLNELSHWYVEGTETPKLEKSAPPNDYGFYQGSMSNHDKVYKNVLDVLIRGSEEKTGAIPGHESIEVIQSAYLSAKTGKEIKLNQVREKYKKNHITAIIPAAGKGKRMGKLSEKIPKPLIKVGEKTLLERSIDLLKYAGINDIIIVTGHLEEQIKDFLKDKGLINQVKLITQEKQLGIPHAIKLASNNIKEDFLILCPDNIFESKEDILNAKDRFQMYKPTALQVTTENLDDEKDRVLFNIDELEKIDKNLYENTRLPMHSTGLTFFSKEALKHIPSFKNIETEYPLSKLVNSIQKNDHLMIYKLERDRHDITKPEDIVSYEEHLKTNKDLSSNE